MNMHANPPSFSSRRKASDASGSEPLILTPAEQVISEAPVAASADPDSKSVLIVSASEHLSNRVATSLREGSDDITASFETATIRTLAKTDAAALNQHHFVVFDVQVGNDLEMAALRDLRQKVETKTRFLAVTSEPVTLAHARLLMDAGFDEVLPLAAVRTPSAPDSAQNMPEDTRNGVIIAMSQTRGGLGATSLTLNLASLLSRSEGDVSPKVAVVDLDFQNGKIGAMIDVEPNGAFMDLLKGVRAVDDSFIADAFVSYRGMFDVLPAPQQFAPLDALKPEAVANLLSELRATYDYVLLDLPRAITGWMEPVLAQTDQMLMVTDTSVSSVRQGRRLIDLYRDEHVALPIKMIVSKEKQPFSLSEAHKEACAFLELGFDCWVPRDDKAARKASTMGVPIVDCVRRSKLTKPLSMIVGELNALQAQPLRRQA